jgi:hemerythrin-like domain-containing protein
MKRSAALAPLSRDHHQALEVALRLRRATEDTVADAVRRLGEYWSLHGERHFEIEERLLLPALPAQSPGWSEASERLLADHREIRKRARRLFGGSADVGAARELGERLNAHVRFEERELFPQLERQLAADELDRLGRAVAEAEQAGDD